MEENKVVQYEEMKMASETEKTERLLKIFNISMFGLIEGLWDLFGEASFATINSIGDKVLQVLESEIGFEIKGDNPKDILMEINQLLVNEVGTMEAGMVVMDESGKVSMACEKCCLRKATAWLEDEGVQPFACVPMNIFAAAIRKKTDYKHKVLGRSWDEESETCVISFQILSS